MDGTGRSRSRLCAWLVCALLVTPAAALAGVDGPPALGDGGHPPDRPLADDDRRPHAPLSEASHQALYLDIGGTFLIFGVNYEVRPLPWVGLRAGASVLPGGVLGATTDLPALGLGVVGLLPLGRGHGIELGPDVLVAASGELVPGASLGYRYENPAGFLLRVTFTPKVLERPFGQTQVVMPWGGASLGYAW